MELKDLIEKCSDALQDVCNEEFCYEYECGSYSTAVNTNCGTIDLFYKKFKSKWQCEVVVYHNDNKHDSPNLETFLSKALWDCVEWDVAEEQFRESCYDEWEEHGFRDEADYNRWRYGGTKW